MLQWRDDLYLPALDLYLDSRHSRPFSFISHAHSDHLGAHDRALVTPATAVLARHRIAVRQLDIHAYQTLTPIRPDISIELLPAGHVLGSAMLHAVTDGGSLLYTGDYSFRKSLTAENAVVREADVLVMESTYGLPHFKFPPPHIIGEQLVELVHDALRTGRQPIVYGYSLGKAQEIVRILTDAGLPVTCHGAIGPINDIYAQFGVSTGPYRAYKSSDFHGETALDLSERGVLVAPPQTARGAFTTRFNNPLRIMMSGWGLLKGASFRYGVDHVLPLSDHADFDGLLELVERVQPKKVYTHHGYPEFVDHLRARGIDAQRAHPPAQMELFT